MYKDIYENEEELIYMLFPHYDRLTPKEKEAFNYRFGFEGNIPHTLKETAEKFNTAATRIKQLEIKACGNLHNQDYRDQLKRYMEFRFETDNS